MNRHDKISLAGLVILLGFVGAVFFHYVMGVYKGAGYPLNTFLFRPDDIFNDFYNVVLKWNQYLPGEPSPFICYFPFAYLLIKPFGLIKPTDLSFALFLALFISALIGICLVALREENNIDWLKNVAIFSCMTFPALFIIDRGNLEAFVFIFLFLFAWHYDRNAPLSVLFLSLATAMKMFPGILVLLFLSDKRYKSALATCLLTALLTLAALLVLEGDIFDQLRRMLENQALFTQDLAIGDKGLDYGHSLFGLMKVAIFHLHIAYPIDQLMRPYNISVAILAMGLALHVLLVERIYWRKLAILILAMCLFPHVSSGYKLIHFLIPLFLLCKAPPHRLDGLYVTLMALLLIPKNYLRDTLMIYGGSVLDPLLMLAFMALLLRSGFKERRAASSVRQHPHPEP